MFLKCLHIIILSAWEKQNDLLEVLWFMILWCFMPCILLGGGKSVSQGGQTIMMEVKGAGASLKWILEGGSNVNWLFWSS